jgi:hypothetical protein
MWTSPQLDALLLAKWEELPAVQLDRRLWLRAWDWYVLQGRFSCGCYVHPGSLLCGL